MLESLPEPAYALLGGAVGKGIRRNPPSRLALQGIVADSGGSAQRFVNVSAFQYIARAVCVMSPHTGKTVCLQFLPHAQAIGFGLTGALPGRLLRSGRA